MSYGRSSYGQNTLSSALSQRDIQVLADSLTALLEKITALVEKVDEQTEMIEDVLDILDPQPDDPQQQQQLQLPQVDVGSQFPDPNLLQRR